MRHSEPAVGGASINTDSPVKQRLQKKYVKNVWESDFPGGCLKRGVHGRKWLYCSPCLQLCWSAGQQDVLALDSLCAPAPDGRSQGIPGTESSFCLRILICKNKGSLRENTLSPSLPTSCVHSPLPSPRSCPAELISKLTFS